MLFPARCHLLWRDGCNSLLQGRVGEGEDAMSELLDVAHARSSHWVARTLREDAHGVLVQRLGQTLLVCAEDGGGLLSGKAAQREGTGWANDRPLAALRS